MINESSDRVDTVACRDHAHQRCELTICPDGSEVFLWLPGENPVWLEILNADRLAHLVLVAADTAARRITP